MLNSLSKYNIFSIRNRSFFMMWLWTGGATDGNAQINLNLGYYDFNIASRNIILWADKTYHNKHIVGMGIKYHLDDPIRSDFSKGTMYRTLSAEKWYEHFGVMVQYKRKLPFKTAFLDPFLFYNFQTTYGSKKIDRFYDFSRRKWWDTTFIVKQMCLFENQIGAGIDIHLSKKVSLYMSVGIGLVFDWNFNEALMEKKFLNITSTYRSFDRMLSGGIKYEWIPPLKKLKVKELSYASEDINN
jgi:hypothetical protein